MRAMTKMTMASTTPTINPTMVPVPRCMLNPVNAFETAEVAVGVAVAVAVVVVVAILARSSVTLPGCSRECLLYSSLCCLIREVQDQIESGKRSSRAVVYDGKTKHITYRLLSPTKVSSARRACSSRRRQVLRTHRTC